MLFKSEASQRLNDELDRKIGHIEDGQGRKIYGHLRLVAARRVETLAILRGGRPPQVEPNALGSAGCGSTDGSAGNSTHETVVIIPASRPPEGYDSPKVVRVAGIKPGPHPPYLIARAACLLVAAASIVTGLSIDGTAFALMASLPAPKLITVALGRV